jgi:transposase
MVPVLGIDIAKATCALALERPDGKVQHKSIPNTPDGHARLVAWLAQHAGGPVHACLEATGPYGDAVALALVDAGHTVSIVNPAAVAAYARSELRRAKTDRTDADVIRRFCAAQQPRPWVPPAPEVRTLQALARRVAAVDAMRQQEANRLAAYQPHDAVRQSIAAVLADLTAEVARLRQLIHDHIDQYPGLRTQRDLLTSIPGVGDTTATVLLAELFGPLPGLSVRQVVASAGLAPRVCQSGSSVHRRGQLSSWGARRLRKALYFPAIVALQHNPVVRALGERLAAAGKCNMIIIVAAMRKLVHLAFGILKAARPFDPAVTLCH